jgi:cytochrome c oxidase assembly protein subunit 11
MRERSSLDEKTTSFRQGSGAFLAGFSSMSLISLGCAFLFVPLYRLYCSPQGRGADPKFVARKIQQRAEDGDDANPVRRKLLSVRFLSDVGNTLPIAFVPLQRSLDVLIGEPALAFYSSYNKSNKTLLGVSTYSISPAEAMTYLNKIQCFCFEEQRFKPHELVEMPVFFYLDKDFLSDPMVSWLDEVILNYTFFNMEKTRDLVGRFDQKM